jgi:hypothetical protein
MGISEIDRRSVALVALGATAGFFPLLTQLPTQVAIPAGLAMLLVMSLCLLYGVGVLQGQYHSYVLGRRIKQPFRIGILSDMGEFVSGADYYVWTDVGLAAWKAAIESMAQKSNVKVSVGLLKASESFDKFSAVLNPFGGAYPEVDLGKLTTLQAILKYVREGGLFVNVADIPTYWAYSSDLKRRIDNTPSTEITTVRGRNIVVIPYRPFGRTPLVKELGLEAFNVEKLNIQQNLDSILGSPTPILLTASRVVELESNVDSCIPPVTLRIRNGSRKLSQMVYVKYGDGIFLLSLAWINDTNQKPVRTHIIDAIAILTLKGLSQGHNQP